MLNRQNHQSGNILFTTLMGLFATSAVLYVSFGLTVHSQQTAIATDVNSGTTNLRAVHSAIYKVLSNNDAGVATRLSTNNPNLNACMSTPSVSNCPVGPNPLTLYAADGSIFVGADDADGIGRKYDTTNHFRCTSYAADGTSPECIYKYKLFWTGNSSTGKITVTGQLEVASDSNVKYNLSQYNISAAFSPVVMVGGCNPSGTPFGGGTGSSGDPYLICTPTQLNAIGANSAHWDKTFHMESNIDMAGFDSTTTNKIGNTTTRFTGVFDGRGNKISNLTPATSNSTGFIAVSGHNAWVEDLDFENVTISGCADAGVVIGLASGSTTTIVNVKVLSATITPRAGCATLTRVGGLAGSWDGDIERSSAIVSITTTANAATYIGGLIGYVTGTSSIVDSFATPTISLNAGTYVGGAIGAANNTITTTDMRSVDGGITILTGTSQYVGGLVGMTGSLSALTTSYSTTPITQTGSTSSLRIGGLIGYLVGGSLSGCYSTGTINVVGSRTGGLVGHWMTIAGAPGSIVNSYSTANITTSGASTEATGGLIGLATVQFTVLTVTNSYFRGNVTGLSRVGGIAGWIESATHYHNWNQVETRSPSNISGTSQVGGLIGYGPGNATNRNAIANSFSAATVTGTGSFVGGIAGQTTQTNFTNISNTGNVTGAGRVGGIAGDTTNVSCDPCISGGTISTSASYGGGLFGSAASTTMNNSSTEATTIVIMTSGQYLGGLAGRVSGTAPLITGAHSSGIVSYNGASASAYIGGLFGEKTSTGTISNSYSNANVEVNSPGPNFGGYVGGLVGSIAASNTITSASHFSGTITIHSGSTPQRIGGLVGYAVAPFTIEQSNFTGNFAIVGRPSYIGSAIGEANLGTTATVSHLRQMNSSGNIEGITPGGFIGYLNVGSGAGVLNMTDLTFNVGVIKNTTNLSGTSAPAGGAIGHVYGSSGSAVLTNVSVKADIRMDDTGGAVGPGKIGGLVGFAENANNFIDILNSNYEGTITASDQSGAPGYAGGLIGETYVNQGAGVSARLRIVRSWAKGAINFTNHWGAAPIYSSAAGGLVGRAGITNIMTGENYTNINISRVGGTNTNFAAGGIFGILISPSSTSYVGVTISNMYTRGNINAPKAGGIIGEVYNNLPYPAHEPLHLVNVYSSGVITGTIRGGTIGRVTVGPNIKYFNTYFNSVVTDAIGTGSVPATPTTNPDGVPAGLAARTTTELKDVAQYTSGTPPWNAWGATWNLTIPDLDGYFKLAWQP